MMIAKNNAPQQYLEKPQATLKMLGMWQESSDSSGGRAGGKHRLQDRDPSPSGGKRPKIGGGGGGNGRDTRSPDAPGILEYIGTCPPVPMAINVLVPNPKTGQKEYPCPNFCFKGFKCPRGDKCALAHFTSYASWIPMTRRLSTGSSPRTIGLFVGPPTKAPLVRIDLFTHSLSSQY